jgi:predicted TPR repeat methyltransferase
MEPYEGLSRQSDSDPESVRKLYDDWASDYDHTLGEWDYEVPRLAVAYLRSLCEAAPKVLDAGCGTGLVGAALKASGYERIVGVDFSGDSLQIAERTGAYEALDEVDLTSLPTSLPADEFDAVVCIGVMSYLPDVEANCREFCRVARPGAPIIFTQRSDLFESRGSRAAFERLSTEGLWVEIEVTVPRPYLPGNPEFDGIGVHYCVFRRQ